MNPATSSEPRAGAVPLLNAVFCVDCETISNSPHDVCTICGNRSLINLVRMLGGTLRGEKAPSGGETPKTAMYTVELAAKVRDIPASELNLIIASMSRLAEIGGAVESLRINVESVLGTQNALRAA
jgi:hypothetical protein